METTKRGLSFAQEDARGRAIATVALFLICTSITLAVPMYAQTYSVLYRFKGGSDGAEPNYGLTIDGSGNLWGTTFEDNTQYGNTYELSYNGSAWDLSVIHFFNGSGYPAGGAAPYATVLLDSEGNLYGTTGFGGINYNGDNECHTYNVYGCGVVYELTKTAGGPWPEQVLYSFLGNEEGNTDGAEPLGGALISDSNGNLYGTTYNGGSSACSGGCGTIYKLTPSNGSWTETVLYQFRGGTDGYWPWSGVTLDSNGNLYGTTSQGGGADSGTVYELQDTGSGWQESVLYSFQNSGDGNTPYAGVIFDGSGNLYGATQGGGSSNGGTIFELSPNEGSWSFHLLYSFQGSMSSPSGGPQANLVLHNGYFYGTTAGDGANGKGNVFKLGLGADGWTYTSLYDFTGYADGGVPHSNVVFDSSGNLYGTTSQGGLFQTSGPYCKTYCGVIFEITNP